MTKTIQPYSYVSYESNENYIKTKPENKPEKEDNKSLMMSVFDSLSNLSAKLNRLNYLLERRRIERILYQEK